MLCRQGLSVLRLLVHLHLARRRPEKVSMKDSGYAGAIKRLAHQEVLQQCCGTHRRSHKAPGDAVANQQTLRIC